MAATERPWPSASRAGTCQPTSRPSRRSAVTRMARPVSPSASKSPSTSTRSPAARARATRAWRAAASGSSRGSWRAARGSPRCAARSAGRPIPRPASSRVARSDRPATVAASASAGDTGASRADDPFEGRPESVHGASLLHGGWRRLTGQRPARTRAAARARRRSSQACQTTSSGLALKIEEYVPETMPISSARTKTRIDSPPKRSSAVSVMMTVRQVLIDRPMVCSRLNG